MSPEHRLISWSVAALTMVCCAMAAPARSGESSDQRLSYRLVAKHPHSTDHFTQGLIFVDGKLIESTGQYGASAIYETNPKTDKTERRAVLDGRFFGEGIAMLGQRFFQLSWREQTAFVYDRDFKLLHRFDYEGEGWGITTLPGAGGKKDRLVISDGSARLRLLDPQTFKQVGALLVRDASGPVAMLNELEYAGRKIYANIWMTDRIVALDPLTGRVLGSLDLSELKQQFEKPSSWDPWAHVLNGIAVDPETGNFFVTGKCWPVIFEIKVLWPDHRSDR